MNKRILIVTILVLAVVLVAQTGAWAGKLQRGDEAPAFSENAGVRPQGTTGDGEAGDGDTPYIPPQLNIETEEDGEITVEDLPAEVVAFVPEGEGKVEYARISFVEDDGVLAEDFVLEFTSLGVGENFQGTLYYWDGEDWVALEVVDGEVTFPAGTPTPIYISAVDA